MKGLVHLYQGYKAEKVNGQFTEKCGSQFSFFGGKRGDNHIFRLPNCRHLSFMLFPLPNNYISHFS